MSRAPTRHAPRIRRRVREAARSLGADREAPPVPPAAALAVAAAGVALLVASGIADSSPVRSAPLDRRVRRLVRARFRDRVPADAWWLPLPETRRHAVAEAVSGLAGDWTTLAVAALAALAVARRRGVGAALPVAAAVQLGNAAHGAVKYAVRRPRPATARLTGKETPSFPSGHAARGAATAGTLAYVAAREGLVTPATGLAVAIAIALASGGGRVYVDRHWGTDAIGGWALGTTVAALSALWYDAARRSDRAGAPSRHQRMPNTKGC